MKKILVIILLIFNIKVKALEDIKINNDSVIPEFNKNTHVYNYYTDKKVIRVNVTLSNKDEIIKGDGIHYLEDGDNIIIIISNNIEYKINVFKNYKKEENSCLESLSIEGYDIKFDKDIYEYNINIDNEEYLNINYELSNDEGYVSIIGNGNFNKTDNIITININNEKEYIIHALKTISVSHIKNEKHKEEMSSNKKEIVSLIIIAISCLLVFLFYYFLFISKTTYYI